MNVLTVSPHPDDAVLGAGQYLTVCPGPVATVFDGVPVSLDKVTPYDAQAGFGSSREAMEQRHAEDADALGILECQRLGLGHFDMQYRSPRPPSQRLARELRQAMESEGAEGLLGPLGLQHPDHLLVADACLHVATQGVPVWLYEELPYRVQWPELAHKRLALVGSFFRAVPDFLGAGDRDIKAKALSCYRSQVLDEHCCLVPERFWRLMPAQP